MHMEPAGFLSLPALSSVLGRAHRTRLGDHAPLGSSKELVAEAESRWRALMSAADAEKAFVKVFFSVACTRATRLR